jgi:hypothetical protein
LMWIVQPASALFAHAALISQTGGWDAALD